MLQEDDVLPRATEPPFFVSTSCEKRHNKLFGYKLGESTENNKAPLFFSGKKTIQTFNGSIKPLRCFLRSDKLVNCHVLKFCKDQSIRTF